MLRAYAFRIGLFAVIGLLLGLIISAVTPPKYEAAIQILVDPHPMQNAAALSPAEKQITDIYESTAPRTVQTQVEQLTGFQVLSLAAQRVAEKRGVNVGAIPELSLQSLQKAVTVEAATESDLITLRVRMSDKDMAQMMGQEIFEAYDEQNHQHSAEAASRAITLLQDQTKKIDGQLNDVDAKLESLRSKYNAPNIDLQVQSGIENVKALEQIMDAAKSEMNAARVRVASLRAQMKSVPLTMEVGSTTTPNPLAQQLEAQLSNARATLAQARTRYEDDHPQVIEQLALVQRYQTELDDVQKQIKASSQKAPNPIYQTLETQLATSVSDEAAAAARYQTAEQQSIERRAELAKLPDVQRKMLELARKQDTLQRLYLDYQQQLTTLEASQRGRLTNTTVVSPSIAFPNPVSPNITLNLGAGLIAGLLLGLLSAFGTESRRSPIRSLSQLNRLTLEPAFRTIPELPFIPLGMEKQPDEVFVTLLGAFIRSGKRPYRVGVIGVDPDTGATVAASAMALGSALEGTRTVLVDTAKENGATKRLGLSENESLIQASDHLTVLRTGGEEMTRANLIVETIKQLEETHSLTVIDLHPFRSSGNPVVYLAGLDECVLLVRAGKARTVDFLQAQQMLVDAGVPHVTVVLARAKSIDDDFTFLPAEPQAQALMGR